MASRYTPPELVIGPIIASSDHRYDFGVLATFTTTGVLPFTIGPLTFPLLAGMVVRVSVRGVARQSDFSNVFEIDSRNAWKRSLAGVSSRLGTSTGVNSSVVNSFMGPKPAVTFSDPAASHQGDVQFIGKLLTTIKWSIFYEVEYGT